MIKNIDYELVEKLVKELHITETLIDEYAKSYKSNKEPEKPEFVDEPLVWLSYIGMVDEFETEQKLCFSYWEQHRKKLKELKLKIIDLLPANTWVRISGDRYLGYQTSSWPMYEPTLQIVGAEENPSPLKHSND